MIMVGIVLMVGMVPAWWFNGCFQSHLNGPYYTNPTGAGTWRGIIWYDWKGDSYSLKFTEMKARRNN